MPGIDEAVQAFERDLGGTRPPRQSETSRPEQVFTPREFEDDEGASGEGSPEGVDDGEGDEPRPRERKARNNDQKEEQHPDGEEEDPEYADLEGGEEEEDGKKKVEEEEEEEEGEEGKVNLNAKVKVKIDDGEEEEVPVKEAINGYIRMETFHRRLNGVKEYKAKVDQEANEVQQARQIYIEKLTEISESLKSFAPQEPDWVAEYEKDPKAAKAAQGQWEQFKKQKAAIESERTRVQQEMSAEQIKRFNAWVDEQSRNTLVMIPEWNDKRKYNMDKQRMQKTLKGAGFSEQEIAQVIDARYLVIARKAALYDALKGVKVQGKGAGNQLRRVGSGNSRTGPTRPSRAAERLVRTGSVHDAALAFENDLQNEGRQRTR